MAATNSPVARQFDDVFTKIAGGYTVSSPTAIASGSFANVTVTVPGVAADGTWEVLSETTTAATLNVAGVQITSNVTGANTVTMTIENGSGASITPTASSKYIVVVGQLHNRFTL